MLSAREFSQKYPLIQRSVLIAQRDGHPKPVVRSVNLVKRVVLVTRKAKNAQHVLKADIVKVKKTTSGNSRYLHKILQPVLALQ